MSGSGKTTTTQQSTQPWQETQPLLKDIIGKAQTLGGNTSNFTPTYSDPTKQAVQQMTAYGQGPGAAQPVLQNLVAGSQEGYRPALDTLINTANGGMIGANPYLDKVLATQGQRTADQVNSQFSGAGRYGSGAHAGVLTDRIGQQEMQARMGNYTTERGNQMNAAGLLQQAGVQGAQLAGQIDAGTLQRAQVMGAAGAQQDTMDNAARLAPMQAAEWQAKLALPMAGLGGSSSGSQTEKTPANVGGMIGGAGMAGLGLATGNPMMMASGIGSFGSGMSGRPTSMPMGGGGGSSGSPFMGIFGKSPVFSQPGTAVNGGWSTTATPASWFDGFGGFGG